MLSNTIQTGPYKYCLNQATILEQQGEMDIQANQYEVRDEK